MIPAAIKLNRRQIIGVGFHASVTPPETGSDPQRVVLPRYPRNGPPPSPSLGYNIRARDWLLYIPAGGRSHPKPRQCLGVSACSAGRFVQFRRDNAPDNGPALDTTEIPVICIDRT